MCLQQKIKILAGASATNQSLSRHMYGINVKILLELLHFKTVRRLDL